MGAANDLRNAFRDFATDGVPASGMNDPSKATLRAAFKKLEAEMSSLGSNILRYQTKALMDADTARADGQLAYVYGDATDANNKVYQWNDGNNLWESAAWYLTQAGEAVQPIVDAAVAEAEEIAELAGRYANAETDADIVGAPAGSRGAKFFANSAESAASLAELALAATLAGANYFPSQAAGEAATSAGEFFCNPSGAGGLVFRERTGGGSTLIAEAATKQMVEARVPFAGNQSIAIDGGTSSGTDFLRQDAAISLRAPAGGTPTQRHVGFQMEQQHTDDESYYLTAMIIDGVKRQIATYFHALQSHNADPGSWRPYMGRHGESWRGDYVTTIEYMDGAMEWLAGTAGGQFFNLGLTAVDWARNFQKTILQGGLKVGNTTQSFDTGGLVEIVGGHLFVGDQASPGAAARRGATLSYANSLSGALLQGYNFGAGALIDLYYNAATHIFMGGNLAFDNDNARSVGTASKRASVIYAGTGSINTSDATTKTLRGDGEMTAPELDWARRIHPLVKAYRFNDAIDEKGEDGARIHWGVLAQEVEAAGRDAGISDPFAYAFLCRDQRLEEKEVMVPYGPRPVKVEKTHIDNSVEFVDGEWRVVRRPIKHEVEKRELVQLKDENGQPMMISVPDPEWVPNPDKPEEKAPLIEVPRTMKLPVMEWGEEPVKVMLPMVDEQDQPVWRYGIRYDELGMFVMRMLEHDLRAVRDGHEQLAARLEVLEASAG